MKIQFRQSGGFAGLELGCELDTATLDASLAKQFEALAATDQPASPATTGADLTRYDIEILKGRRRKCLTFDDMNLTAEAAPRIELLSQRATPVAR